MNDRHPTHYKYAVTSKKNSEVVGITNNNKDMPNDYEYVKLKKPLTNKDGRKLIGKPIDLGEVCVHCRESVAFGSGKFVDRYPVFGLEDEGIEYDGYCCDECEQQWINDNPEIVEQLNEDE